MANTDKVVNNIFGTEKAEVLNQLLHSCADEICGNSGPEYDQYNNSTDWNKKDFHFICKLFVDLLRNPATLYLETEKMPVVYHELPEFVQSMIFSCLKVRREQLIDALIRDIAKNDAPTISNFDWKVKYVMGTSFKTSKREALLQLDFSLDDKDSQKTLSLEMNENELDSFINTLESYYYSA